MLRYMTAGESHGKALTAVLDGMPAGLKLDQKYIDNELSRRMEGYGRGGRMKIEKDKAIILSGSRKGLTIGSPVAIMIENRDFKIDKLSDIFCPRPGHADLAGMQKYDLASARDVLERASARETAARVAAGAVAKLFLLELGVNITSHVTGIGGIRISGGPVTIKDILKKTKTSRLRCIDRKAEKKMIALIDENAKEGNTLGGEFEVQAEGVPAGVGTYSQWDRRLDGMLAKALMSIQAVKAVAIGDGIDESSRPGSLVHDPIKYASRKFSRLSNNAGGIEGGISNGETIVVKGYMKPIATLMDPLDSVNVRTKKRGHAATERSDTVAVPACGVVAEAVVAIELAGAFMEKFGSDALCDIKRNLEVYIKRLRNM